jgi:hypothetical protein
MSLQAPRSCRLIAALAPFILAGGLSGLFAGPALALESRDPETSFGPFVISSFTTSVSTTQAGAHPDANTSFGFSRFLSEEGFNKRRPDEEVRDILLSLPPGLLGDATAVPECATPAFKESSCPAATQVGVANLLIGSTTSRHEIPVVSLEHGAGEPARLGIERPVPADISIAVRTGGDDGLNASITNVLIGAQLDEASVTLWGVPAAHWRGCESESFTPLSGDMAGFQTCIPATPPLPLGQQRPFMTNPTTCASGPLATTLTVDSYAHPGAFEADGAPDLSDPNWKTASSTQPAPTGCAALAFDPAIAVTPDSTQVDSPAGYTVTLAVPQNDDPTGLASSQLRRAVVTLPPGVTLNPSVANGLQACTDEQFSKGSSTPPACPAASQIGTNEVLSPDLANPLHGQIFVGEPLPGETYRIFQNIEGEGLDVKLEGRASPDPVTGQLTATFENLPQLPFGEFKLHLDGGSRAPLANPPTCGTASTASDLTPWSGNEDATPSSSFAVSLDGLGGACASALPFAPSFSAGSSSLVAGGPTTFSLTLTRADRTQYLGGLGVHLPAGLVGNLSSVPLCPLASARAGACPATSEIGTVTAEAGAGAEPFTLPGTVYLAQPRIPNSPASLSIVVPAIAGPYNLGNVIVGADVVVSNDGSLTVSSDPLPTILEGVPLRIRQIGVDITRPGFMTNPTSCAAQSVHATIVSTVGQSAGASSPFQLADCQALAFSPKFTVTTQGSASAHKNGNGASLTVKVTAAPGQANIHAVAVSLPKQLPARLTTIQKACRETTFQADPASCPRGSIIGTASAITPILPRPLVGPAYLVSHGGAAFPNIEVLLQGNGITIDLTGSIDIKRAITSSSFAAVPDVAISSFQLKLPEGPSSALASPGGNLCGKRLAMPTTITAQSGKQIRQSTRIAIEGCPKAKVNAKPKRKQAKARKARHAALHGGRTGR